MPQCDLILVNLSISHYILSGRKRADESISRVITLNMIWTWWLRFSKRPVDRRGAAARAVKNAVFLEDVPPKNAGVTRPVLGLLNLFRIMIQLLNPTLLEPVAKKYFEAVVL